MREFLDWSTEDLQGAPSANMSMVDPAGFAQTLRAPQENVSPLIGAWELELGTEDKGHKSVLPAPALLRVS